MSTLAVVRPSPLIEQDGEHVAPGWLRPPPLRAGVIERPRLTQALERLTHEPLTMVAAPAGYGKTTLLVSWAAATDRQVVWASVGSRDLDADGFWALTAAALEQAEPRLGLGLRSRSRAGDRPAQMAAAFGSASPMLTLERHGHEEAPPLRHHADFRLVLRLDPR